MDTLNSGDDTFGGEESNNFTPVIQAKFLIRPMRLVNILWLADDWSESEVENKSEQEDHDDKGNQSDRAEKSTPEMKIAEIDTLVSERYVCNEKPFSVIVA